jgi:hypothetical protein
MLEIPYPVAGLPPQPGQLRYCLQTPGQRLVGALEEDHWKLPFAELVFAGRAVMIYLGSTSGELQPLQMAEDAPEMRFEFIKSPMYQGAQVPNPTWLIGVHIQLWLGARRTLIPLFYHVAREASGW